MRLNYLLAALLFYSLPSHALEIAGTLGWAPGRFTQSISVQQPFHLPFGLRIGPGLRHSTFYGQQVNFRSARADLVNSQKRDHLCIDDAWIHSANAAVFVAFSFLNGFEVGMNLDIAGFSYGPSRNGRHSSSFIDAAVDQRASPTRWNLFLIDPKDIGSLNSEFFVSLVLWDGIKVRLGLSHYFAEYTTDQPLAFGNRRFRRVSNFAFVSAVWSL